MTGRKIAALAGGLVASLAVAMALTASASAEHGYPGVTADRHVYVPGNPGCPEGTADGTSFKIEAGDIVVGSEYPSDTKLVRVTSYDGTVFGWTFTAPGTDGFDVAAVIVKGGSGNNDANTGGAIIYFYNDTSDDGDSGLAPPINDSTGQPFGISHVQFCLDPKDEGEPATVAVSKTGSGTFDVGHDWTITKQVKVAGASDATYGPTQTLALDDGGHGSVTWKVTVGHSSLEKNFTLSGTITLANTGDEDAEGVTVTDSIPGAVVDCDPKTEGAQSSGLTVPEHGSLQCSYTVQPGSKVATNTATATWGEGQTATSGPVGIQWTTGSETGVPATVGDTGAIDDTQIGLGDLVNDQWVATYDERWSCTNGKASPNAGRTNVATVRWDSGESSAEASASVTVGCGATPPPPSPPRETPKIDVQVVKDATAAVVLGSNGTATITYTAVVRNNGPNQANGVVFADAAPSGVVFGAITKQPDFGSCTVGPALLTCTLGTMGLGVQTSISWTATVSQAGTYVNSATATGSGGPDTNPSNNTDDARTVVTAPFVPPTPSPSPKPKPKPKTAAAICATLKVTQRVLTASGTPQVIRATVTRGAKKVAGARVLIVGPGIRLVVTTNKNGVATAKISPTRPGIVRVSISNKKGCNTQRIGVVGVFEPPVTG